MQYFPNSKRRPSSYAFALIPALLLAGCGGGSGSVQQGVPSNSIGSNSSDANGNVNPLSGSSTTIEGVAMKGAIQNGIVSIYGVTRQASYYQVTDYPLVSSVRTDNSGYYKVVVPNTLSKLVVVKVTADTDTQMICDVSSGCNDVDGSPVSFGAAMGVPSNFQLISAGSPDKQTLSIYLTTLTTLAFHWAEKQNGGISASNLLSGRQKVADLLNLPVTVFDRKPLDLTKLTSTDSVSNSDLNYAIYNASFLAIAKEPAWGDVATVIQNASERFSESGTLANVNLGGLPEVTLSDLLYSASTIASELSNNLSSNDESESNSSATNNDTSISDQLEDVATITGEQAQDVIDTAETLDPVKITFGPTSTTASTQESVTLNVNATGSEPIRYQWRKDGQAISGAITEHLALLSLQLSDAGLYDCVVSNDAGSVTSNSAQIVVTTPSITLTWLSPETRIDGSYLGTSELKGYRLNYGTSANDLSESITIDDPYTTEYSFGSLPTGTYYFSIIAIDVFGNESNPSPVVSKNI